MDDVPNPAPEDHRLDIKFSNEGFHIVSRGSQAVGKAIALTCAALLTFIAITIACLVFAWAMRH
jgi:hypothetical protein